MVAISGTKKRKEVVLSDKLNQSSVAEVTDALRSACAEAKAIELNLDGVTGIDLAGYQLLLSLSKTVQEKKIQLTVQAGSCRARLEKLGEFAGLAQPFAEHEGWQK